MTEHHLHIHLDVFALAEELRQGFAQLTTTLTRLGEHMSDAADALTAAVTGMQERLDTLNTTIQTEVQQITAALTTAGTDQALRDAAALAVDRLNAMGQQVDAFNTTVQDIIA